MEEKNNSQILALLFIDVLMGALDNSIVRPAIHTVGIALILTFTAFFLKSIS